MWIVLSGRSAKLSSEPKCSSFATVNPATESWMFELPLFLLDEGGFGSDEKF